MTPIPSLILSLRENIARVVVGKDAQVTYALIALLCQGHVLIEDVPGVGKTALASALARSLDCSFRRIQFTPDLMPSDVTGYTMLDFSTGQSIYREGAVMSQVVLADEINRTSPKTQSALLEAMEEGQVTVDGVTHPLPQPFIVLATQNPGEFVGTYPLPEAQLDRFFLRISIGYPSLNDEIDILDRYSRPQKPLDNLQSVCSAADILALQQQVKAVYCAREVRAYIAAIVAATRTSPHLSLGASTRAAIALTHGAQATALLSGRDYIIPEDVQYMALPVLCHRLVLSADAYAQGLQAEAIVSDILRHTAVPLKA